MDYDTFHMGRLEKHQNKKFFQQLLWIAVLGIGFIIFIFSFGIKLLINGSLFINQLANPSANKDVTSKSGNVLTSLTVDSLPPATSSANLVVSGSVVNLDSVDIYMNGERMTTAVVVNDTFSEEISGLEKGENSIYVKGRSKKSKEVKKQ